MALPAPADATRFTVDVVAPHMPEYTEGSKPTLFHDIAIDFVGDTADWVLGDPDWGDYLDFENMKVDVDGGAAHGGHSYVIDSARYLPSGWDFYADFGDGLQQFLHDESELDALINVPGTNGAEDGLRPGIHPGNLSLLALPDLRLGNATTPSTWTLSRIEAAGAVPEPATWGMFLFGFAFTGAALRRESDRIGRASVGAV